MVIKISQPKYLNERGKRKNNEDAILPANPTLNDTLFLVCDGVGGAARGEVASLTVAQTVYQFIQQNFKRFTSDADVETIVQGAIEAAELVLNQYIAQNPIAKGMGTTLTLLHLHEGGATIAHVGDSRIYHFRKEELPYVTDDHSYINEMVKSGLMTHAQAHNHPNRNIITRAIQGLPERAVRAEVRVIKNIQAGDYFLLCTDGVTEGCDDDLLSRTILADSTDDNKIAYIQKACDTNAQDNFSCFLIPVASVAGAVSQEDHFPKAAFFEMSDTDGEEPSLSETAPMLPLPNNNFPKTMVESAPPFSNPNFPTQPPTQTVDNAAPPQKRMASILWIAGLLAIAGGAVFAGIQIGKDSNKTETPVVTTPAPESHKPPVVPAHKREHVDTSEAPITSEEAEDLKHENSDKKAKEEKKKADSAPSKSKSVTGSSGKSMGSPSVPKGIPPKGDKSAPSSDKPTQKVTHETTSIVEPQMQSAETSKKTEEAKLEAAKVAQKEKEALRAKAEAEALKAKADADKKKLEEQKKAAIQKTGEQLKMEKLKTEEGKNK